MDYCSKEGARKLCETIEAFWRECHYFGIKTWIEEFKVPWESRHKGEESVGYMVRSNIGPDGYPPAYVKDQLSVSQY